MPFAALVAACTVLAVASSARAALDSCGGVVLSSDAKCEYLETSECTRSCTEQSVATSCAAELYGACESECGAEPSGTCGVACDASCMADCEAARDVADGDPEAAEAPSCVALCKADCARTQPDLCEQDDGACNTSHAYICDARCEAACSEAGGKLDAGAGEGAAFTNCADTCGAACNGSCTAQANAQCQLDCQEESYGTCESSQVETCKEGCNSNGGALFCDEEFVPASDVDACIDELGELNIEVDFGMRLDSDLAADAVQLDQCGNVFLTPEAACEVRADEQCSEGCTEESVEAVCAALIHFTCEKSCTGEATSYCKETCNATCVGSCEQAVDVEVDCLGLCTADCEKDGFSCDDDTGGPCRAAQTHNCSARCAAECKEESSVTTAAQCEPTCEDACAGSCAAQATAECQLRCQVNVYADCQAERLQACRDGCATTGKALFCDGAFVASGDLAPCVDQLASRLDVETVRRTDSTDAPTRPSNNEDDNQAREVRARLVQACSASTVGGSGNTPRGFGVAGLLGLFALVVRRSRTQRCAAFSGGRARPRNHRWSRRSPRCSRCRPRRSNRVPRRPR